MTFKSPEGLRVDCATSCTTPLAVSQRLFLKVSAKPQAAWNTTRFHQAHHALSRPRHFFFDIPSNNGLVIAKFMVGTASRTGATESRTVSLESKGTLSTTSAGATSGR